MLYNISKNENNDKGETESYKEEEEKVEDYMEKC